MMDKSYRRYGCKSCKSYGRYECKNKIIKAEKVIKNYSKLKMLRTKNRLKNAYTLWNCKWIILMNRYYWENFRYT